MHCSNNFIIEIHVEILDWKLKSYKKSRYLGIIARIYNNLCWTLKSHQKKTTSMFQLIFQLLRNFKMKQPIRSRFEGGSERKRKSGLVNLTASNKDTAKLLRVMLVVLFLIVVKLGRSLLRHFAYTELWVTLPLNDVWVHKNFQCSWDTVFFSEKHSVYEKLCDSIIDNRSHSWFLSVEKRSLLMVDCRDRDRIWSVMITILDMSFLFDFHIAFNPV